MIVHMQMSTKNKSDEHRTLTKNILDGDDLRVRGQVKQTK